MAPEKKGDRLTRIPISFLDSDNETSSPSSSESSELPVSNETQNFGEQDVQDQGVEDQELMDNVVTDNDAAAVEVAEDEPETQASSQADGSAAEAPPSAGGPEVAELVASRAELKRLEGEVKELKESLARRQADFENYRKRMERERTETYNRVVADIAAKLLPVLDNLKRALETEASVEASESDEFRHFLSGVDLIYKQLNGVLDALGVKPVLAEGEQFDPHVHEAVVTEPSDDYEPDTVIQEIVRGFRMGDKLIRPALVKVSVKK
jgi:molecular chaperone GrpE